MCYLYFANGKWHSLRYLDELVFNIERYFTGVLSSSFSTMPAILKQFGLEYFSWSSSWLSNESTCYWRDCTFSSWISENCYLNDSLLNMIETAFWVAISSFERNFYRVSNAWITGRTSITQSARIVLCAIEVHVLVSLSLNSW